MKRDIVIKCPKTGEIVPTDIAMDEAGFEKAYLGSQMFRCPACGLDHVWAKKDARLQ